MQHSTEWMVYTPGGAVVGSRNPVRRMVADCLASRSLAWRLFVRDFSAKYRQSFLGYAWAFIPPIALTLTFTLAGQASILNTESSSVPYPAFALIGMVLWQTFAEAVHGPMLAVSQSKTLLPRIKLPYEALVLAKLGEQLVNLLIRLGLVAFILVWYGIDVNASVLLSPLPVLGLLLLGTALGLMLAPLGGVYEDVGTALTMLIGLWFLLTPVMYEQAAPGSTVELLNTWNPVAPLLLTGRQLLTGGEVTRLADCLMAAAVAGPLLIFGWVIYRSSLSFAIERISA